MTSVSFVSAHSHLLPSSVLALKKLKECSLLPRNKVTAFKDKNAFPQIIDPSPQSPRCINITQEIILQKYDSDRDGQFSWSGIIKWLQNAATLSLGQFTIIVKQQSSIK